MPYGVAAWQKAIAAYSTANARCLPEFEAVVECAAGHQLELALRTPSDTGSGCSEMLRKAGLAGKIARIDLEDQKLLLDLFTKSAADDPAIFFESDVVKGHSPSLELSELTIALRRSELPTIALVRQMARAGGRDMRWAAWVLFP